jgi:uncharacterized membrane protein YozB (DUF420 family)
VREGFLGTAAPWSSDATLITELVMGVSLLAGAALARRGRYRARACCQSAVVLLNLVAIAVSMAPTFRRSFTPPIPGSLGDAYYVLAAAHASLGTVAELLALYIVMAARTKILPKSLRFTRYRSWMRAALFLWWLALLFGLATYVRWYVMPLFV